MSIVLHCIAMHCVALCRFVLYSDSKTKLKRSCFYSAPASRAAHVLGTALHLRNFFNRGSGDVTADAVSRVQTTQDMHTTDKRIWGIPWTDNLYIAASLLIWQTVAAQRSKGARSFRGQNIFEPGHPDALFFLKKVDDPF